MASKRDGPETPGDSSFDHSLVLNNSFGNALLAGEFSRESNRDALIENSHKYLKPSENAPQLQLKGIL